MRSIVATFADIGRAEALVERLRTVMGLVAGATSIGTIAAYKEPHDGHRVVAAWVPDDREAEAQRWVMESGGVLHPQPALAPISDHLAGVPVQKDGRISLVREAASGHERQEEAR